MKKHLFSNRWHSNSIVVSVSVSVSVYFTTLRHLGFLLFAMPSSEPISLFPHAYINLEYASLSVKKYPLPISLNLSIALTKHSPMASPPKSIHIASCIRNAISLILVVFLLIASCTATRPGAAIPVKPHRGKDEMGFRYRAQIFGFFPKGTPVPPSGPSKRHNSVVDSTKNWVNSKQALDHFN